MGLLSNFVDFAHLSGVCCHSCGFSKILYSISATCLDGFGTVHQPETCVLYSLSGLSWEVSAFLGQFLDLFYEWFSLLRDSNCGLYECFETIQHVMDARIDLFLVHLDEGCRLGNLEIYVKEITIK